MRLAPLTAECSQEESGKSSYALSKAETSLAVIKAFDPGAGAVVLEEEIRESVINTVGAAFGAKLHSTIALGSWSIILKLSPIVPFTDFDMMIYSLQIVCLLVTCSKWKSDASKR